ncbi:hypothetical protein ACFFWD_03545 [Bradyrhizobium erythrophlei]|uniref:hypothetical protein n=1 Tax=Bradyrhizobium erythrophlei TaxID=1437360 RepID=UPI0035E51AA1
MDIAPDRINPVHASKLRLVKDMRERSALRELSNMEAKRRVAVLAVEHAFEDLAGAEKHRARVEVELYRELASFDGLPVVELDRRCHLAVARLTAAIASAQRTLDEARIAQQQAEEAMSETRSHWASCSAASLKWQEIDCDVRRATNTHSEAAAEAEADDEVLLRYRSGSRTQTVDGSI